jgi:hypothetical protein
VSTSSGACSRPLATRTSGAPFIKRSAAARCATGWTFPGCLRRAEGVNRDRGVRIFGVQCQHDIRGARMFQAEKFQGLTSRLARALLRPGLSARRPLVTASTTVWTELPAARNDPLYKQEIR